MPEPQLPAPLRGSTAQPLHPLPARRWGTSDPLFSRRTQGTWGPETGSPGFRGGEVSPPNAGLSSPQGGLGGPVPLPAHRASLQTALTSLCLCSR